MRDGGCERPACLRARVQAKTDDMTKEDFHIIKHVKISHFIMHMGITGEPVPPCPPAPPLPVTAWLPHAHCCLPCSQHLPSPACA